MNECPFIWEWAVPRPMSVHFAIIAYTAETDTTNYIYISISNTKIQITLK